MSDATLTANPPATMAIEPANLAPREALLLRLAGWREPLLAGLLFTLWSLSTRGFDGARWSDVPIIKSFADPRLYRQDPFIMVLHDGTPAAYPYQLIAAVVQANHRGASVDLSARLAPGRRPFGR
jgi:hypothetical protein